MKGLESMIRLFSNLVRKLPILFVFHNSIMLKKELSQ